MISNFIKIAFRNLYRQLGYTFINIAGLAIGLACSILISLYVINEITYDRFHENAERIYRIGVKGKMLGNDLNQAVTAAPMYEVLGTEYPEIEHVTRIAKFGGWLIKYGGEKNLWRLRRLSFLPIQPFLMYSAFTLLKETLKLH